MKWRWQLTTAWAKARRPWSPSELVRVNHFPQLRVSMGLSKFHQAQVGSSAHLVPAVHLELHLPPSSCLPVVCVPRLRSHLSAGESPAGLSGIPLPTPDSGARRNTMVVRQSRNRTTPQCPVFPVLPYWTSGRKESGKGDRTYTLSLADLNPFPPRTAAQT